MRVRTSKIWSIPREQLESMVKEQGSISSILNLVGLRNIGGNYLTLRKRLTEEGIDFSHIKRGLNSNKGRTFDTHSLSKEECIAKYFILHEEKFVYNSKLRYFARKHNLLEYKCECGNVGEWLGSPINLQLHHKDGNTQNNRLENLSWLCPNCHSQTPNFAGKSNAL